MRLNRISIVIVLLTGLVACGASARQRTINATFAATNAAGSAFAAYDRQHQLDIVAVSTDKGTATTLLNEWRVHQTEAEHLFAGAYKAIAAAAVANDDPGVTSMLAAALLLSQGLHDMGVTSK